MIDWEEQWREFAPQFHDGLAHIDLGRFGGPIFCLKPGGGFGDYSHPTTRLVIGLMACKVKGATVFDIGCGSGILSIAAALLGAKRVYGVDIDDEAIRHSKENAVLNKVQGKVGFSKELDAAWANPKRGPFVILMNMIESEQQIAWGSVPQLHNLKSTVITSGLLTAHKERYLKQASSWSWAVKEEAEEGGWSGFMFEQ